MATLATTTQKGTTPKWLLKIKHFENYTCWVNTWPYFWAKVINFSLSYLAHLVKNFETFLITRVGLTYPLHIHFQLLVTSISVLNFLSQPVLVLWKLSVWTKSVNRSRSMLRLNTLLSLERGLFRPPKCLKSMVYATLGRCRRLLVIVILYL